MYFILSLPRSRSTWMSAFLSEGQHICYHEKGIEFSRVEDLLKLKGGVADTALAVYYKQLLVHPVVMIHRPFKDVVESCNALGFGDCSEVSLLNATKLAMEEAKNNRYILHVNYQDLDDRLSEICAFIGRDYNATRHREFRAMNIQPNNKALMNRVLKYQDNFRALFGAWL